MNSAYIIHLLVLIQHAVAHHPPKHPWSYISCTIRPAGTLFPRVWPHGGCLVIKVWPRLVSVRW